MTNEEAEKILEKAALDLGEFFSSVQILASWPDGEGRTKGSKRGCGDWYARQGLAHEFISENNAVDTANAIARELKEPPEDWQTP